MPGPTIVVSDVHLGSPASAGGEFLSFLRRLRGRVEHVLINGDLFDFWFEYRSVIPAHHFETLKVLSDLKESGAALTLVGGNHDAWGGRFLEEEIGMQLADGPVELEVGGRRALVAHGDGLGEGDKGYKMLKRFLRSRSTRRLIRLMHPDLAERVARRVSRTGGHGPEGLARSQTRGDVLEALARRMLEERSELELVIFAHCHRPRLVELDDRRCYVNSGDWIEHRTYTLVTRDRIEQKEWKGEDPLSRAAARTMQQQRDMSSGF